MGPKAANGLLSWRTAAHRKPCALSGPWAGRGFALGLMRVPGWVLPGEHSLTCTGHRAMGSPGTPRKRVADSLGRTHTRCSGTGHGHCTRIPAGSGSLSWTARTGRPSPRSPVCRGTCHRSIPPDLEDSKATAESPPPAPRPSDLGLCSPGPRPDLLLQACLSSRPLCPPASAHRRPRRLSHHSARS